MKHAQLGFVVAWLLGWMMCPLLAQSGGEEAARTISVSGEAIVYVQPNKVVVTIGAETFDKDLAVSKKKNNELIAKAFALLKEQEIPAADIQTDMLALEPVYNRDYNNPNNGQLLGYNSRNMFMVTIHDVKKLEAVLSAMLLAGINRIQGIEFQTKELKTHREKARAMALLAAKEKAEKMAATLGQSIGAPLKIQENASGLPLSGYNRANAMTQNASFAEAGELPESSETVSLGKIPVKANVSVTFELVYPGK